MSQEGSVKKASESGKSEGKNINDTNEIRVKQNNIKSHKMEKTMAQKNTTAFDNQAFDKFAKEAADIGREYSEACVKSSTIFMKGFEDIITTVMSIAQSSAERQAQFAKEAMSSKTINEFAEVQNKIARANFDDMVANATKITELSTKLLTESAEPVNEQLGKAIKKASESMAA